MRVPRRDELWHELRLLNREIPRESVRGVNRK